jgi:Flp pilus assembly protein TadD
MKLSPLFRLAVVAVMAAALSACGEAMDPQTTKGDNYESVVKRADDARRGGELDTALPLYGRALQINPEGVEAKLGLGQAYLAIGAGDEAAAQFRDVLARRSGDPAARRGLAAALISMGQAELAEKQADALLQSDPRDYRALNTLGVALDMQGRHTEAQARYRDGLEIASDNVSLRSNMGLSLAISGDAPAAVAMLAPISSGRGADARVRQNLALAYAVGGNLENALQVCRADLSEADSQRQLSYFMRLRALPPQQRSFEIRRNPAFFPQGGGAT